MASSSSSAAVRPVTILDQLWFVSRIVDEVRWVAGAVMQSAALVTTGLRPLVQGSTEMFELQGYIDGLPWLLSWGSAQLTLTDPLGVSYAIPASIPGQCPQASWTVIGPQGTWTRQWRATDPSGLTQVSSAIAFVVQ